MSIGISQSQKMRYYMMTLIWNVQYNQIYRGTKQISDCLGLNAEMEIEIGNRSFWGGVVIMLKIDYDNGYQTL
jgi:hypothetical protein